jgi:predicted RNase H-like HicB family nuclease
MPTDLSYRVILEPEDDACGFQVIVPALPHVHTHGDTIEEALQMAREAIALELSYLHDKGLEVPPSDGMELHISRVNIPPSAA